MYYIFKAQKWLEKDKRTISELLTEKNCRFCYGLGKDVLHETNYYEISKAKYPYAPNHLLIIPKKHIPSLHFMNEEFFFDFLEMVKKTKMLDVNFMANYGYIGGQTLSHLHIHMIGNLKKNPFKVEVNSPNLFYDPLTLPIIYEAKLERFLCDHGLVFCFKKNFYKEMISIFYELEEGLRKIVNSENKFSTITKYGFDKNNLKLISHIYESPIDEINNINSLLKNRFGGFGVNWHFNLTSEGSYIFNIIPRATILKTHNPEIRFGSLEMFYNVLLARDRFGDEDNELWNKMEIEFINYVLKKF